MPVEDPELETAPYYKTSALELHRRGEVPTESQGPPYQGASPSLTEVSRAGPSQARRANIRHEMHYVCLGL